MAVRSAPLYERRSSRASSTGTVSTSTPPPDPLAVIQLALASLQGHQLIELLAAQLKTNQFIGQPAAIPHDFNLSHGAQDVMYVTFRMGPRQELVFKIGPQTIMRDAIDRCLETWRNDEGGGFMASELFFHLPCNSRIDYYKSQTAAQLGVENRDQIDVYIAAHGG